MSETTNQKTASGLQYRIVAEGSGENAKRGDIVAVHYHGTLADGTVFDSSYNRGKPIEFTLGIGQVIKGWDEGIALLNPGAKAVLTIPPHIAYGAMSRGKIPANATLTFEVELVSITPPPPPFEPYPFTQDELIKTSSGLQYKIVKEGLGSNAARGQAVAVHYHGTLTNGDVFDSSFERGEPFVFRLGAGQVIPGWDEGIALLNVGAQAVLVLPPNLGYGARGAGDDIPPNSTLIFYVELMGAR